MSESFLASLLPNSGWGLKISALVPSSRWGFCLGTVLVNAVVFTGCWLAGAHVVVLSPKLLIITGLGAQVALVRKREADIQPRRKWRFWYAATIALVALVWVGSATGIGTVDRIRTISSIVLGGFFMFQILIIPVTVSCCISKSLPPP